MWAQPTVNGLFHGDGDDAIYAPYATSQNGSVLYSYYDAPTTTLYVALVVDHSVNDLVCSPTTNRAYTQSAGWNPRRTCRRASDSEFATFTFECAPGSPNAWTWQQALGCPQISGPPQSSWVSDSSCGPSSVATAWPPGVEANATSSFVANINTYQAAAPATRAWNLYTFGTDSNSWKSPFVASAPDDVTQVPGYPTYSTIDGSGLAFDWEWSMIYEWSLDLGPGGADCGNERIIFISGLSHHSPGKAGSEDDPFDPPPNPIFADWGDVPDTYGTTGANGGAQHYLKVNAPYLGSSILAEADGQPSTDATGDGTEEDGVSANVTSDWTVGSSQSLDVTVANAPVGGAWLGAWLDWNGDGDFDDAGEFFSFSGLTDGSHTLAITVGSGFDWQTDPLYARFRLFSSPAAAPSAGATLVQSDATGTAEDGEVEDYRFDAGTLPVTLNAFSSERIGTERLVVRWQTASESQNAGFEIWGRVDGRWRPVSPLVQSKGGTSALPQSYETVVEAPPGLRALRIVDHDTRGRADTHGPFQVGADYGTLQTVRTIDWNPAQAERAARLKRRGFTALGQSLAPSGKPSRERWKKVRPTPPLRTDAGTLGGRPLLADRARAGGSPFEAPATLAVTDGAQTHVAVATTGIQRLTYEALLAGGLDLAGVPAARIAVAHRGKPVSRWIGGTALSSRGRFGPGSYVEFLGLAPTGDDALYLEANLYQIGVDPARARPVRGLGPGKIRDASPWHLVETRSDRPALFHPQSPTGDPWIERVVLARNGTAAEARIGLQVAGPLAFGPSELLLGLGAISNLANATGAEHQVEVWLRRPDGSRTFVTESSASGQRDWRITAPVPGAPLEPGLHEVELRFSTDAFFSLVAIDTVGIRTAKPYRGPTLDFSPDPGASGYRVEGFASPAIAAYVEDREGGLRRLAPRVQPSGFGWTAELRPIDGAVRYWVTEAPQTPEVFTTAAPPDLLGGSADLVVLAAPSFVDSPALADYVASRAHLRPVVVDLEDVYNAFGHGMAVPSAVTDFLAARDAVAPFTHVQLVGADCYDRLNHISDCVSFVPLPTARVGATIYSPSQNRLVDLDGDGVGDKAVGQFSVRDEAELATIVRKAQAWETSGLAGSSSALLIAEEGDGTHDFDAQIDRLRGLLSWAEVDLLRLTDHPDVGTARQALNASLDAGRSITTFSGHSSPTVWGFRSLLSASNAATLTNAGRPTLMVPLACETTYDVSPNAEVLAHRLLYGGDAGALAISGAASLANLADNERMAGLILEGLRRGLTLGAAVLEGRRALGATAQELQDNWLTQGDVAVRFSP